MLDNMVEFNERAGFVAAKQAAVVLKFYQDARRKKSA